MSVVAVRRSFLAKNRDVVKRFLMAYAEATYQFKTNKEKGMALYRSRLKQDNIKALEETYNYFAPKFAFPIRISRSGMANTLDMMVKENSKIDARIEKYIDEGVLDELEKEGFFDKIAAR